MAKDFGEYVVKGDMMKNHLKTERGRALLSWMAGQPLDKVDEKFKSWTINRNKWIKENVELYSSVDTVGEESGGEGDKTTTDVVVLMRLNEILSKLKMLDAINDRILHLGTLVSWDKKQTPEENVWDD